jgi:hypothetical protein
LQSNNQENRLLISSYVIAPQPCDTPEIATKKLEYIQEFMTRPGHQEEVTIAGGVTYNPGCGTCIRHYFKKPSETFDVIGRE